MSELFQKLGQDIKEAMKAKEKERLSCLRMLKSDIQYEMTKTGADTVSDEEFQSVVKRAIKKRNESAEQYEKASRSDLAANERSEIKFFEIYLPAEIQEDQIKSAIDEILAKNPIDPKQAGKITGMVMGRFKGENINGALVKKLIEERLSKN